MTMAASDWSIWTFCYALGRLPYDFLSGSPIHSNRGTVEVPMIVSLLESARGERILVDTGFRDGASMTGRRFENFVRSDELLRRFGFDPAAITTLVLTHMHFDHAGNLPGFPNARIYLQRAEYEGWQEALARYGAGAATKDHWVYSSLNLEDFAALERAMAEGRVELLDGDAELAPGVHCRLARDTHTFGSQWLEVATARGPFVLAGDCCYTFQNLERMWPPGYLQGDAWKMLRAFERMKQVAGEDLARLIPGHDIELFARFPSGNRGGTRFIEANLAAGHASLLGA